jgi:hypothetical protein
VFAVIARMTVPPPIAAVASVLSLAEPSQGMGMCLAGAILAK